jgi:hypothetical protein
MISIRFFPGVLRATFPAVSRGAVAAVVVGCALMAPLRSEDAVPMPPFRPYVDMKTFMIHVHACGDHHMAGQWGRNRRQGRA